MEEDERLRSAASWQFKPRQSGSRLGDDIMSYLKRHHRTLEKNASVVDVWQQAVPELLRDHCKLDKRVGDTLYVQVVPGAYMHQTQMMAGEVLEKIKQMAPRCGIQKIRMIPMQRSIEES